MNRFSAQAARAALAAIVITIVATTAVQSESLSASLQVSVVVTNPCTVKTSDAGNVALTCARSAAAPLVGVGTADGKSVMHQQPGGGDFSPRQAMSADKLVVRVDF